MSRAYVAKKIVDLCGDDPPLYIDEGGNTDDELRDFFEDALANSKEKPVVLILGAKVDDA